MKKLDKARSYADCGPCGKAGQRQVAWLSAVTRHRTPTRGAATTVSSRTSRPRRRAYYTSHPSLLPCVVRRGVAPRETNRAPGPGRPRTDNTRCSRELGSNEENRLYCGRPTSAPTKRPQRSAVSYAAGRRYLVGNYGGKPEIASRSPRSASVRIDHRTASSQWPKLAIGLALAGKAA
jgi:hypothetical protein